MRALLMRLRRATIGICALSAMLVLALMLWSSALAAEPKFPALSGRVVDDADVLNASTVGELTLMLADHERTTGEQVVVVTLASLQGYTIEDYGYQLGRHWGIGQKSTNNGALLIVVPKEHKVRIEVGYGLEGELTDAISRTIIENNILPAFRRGDFNAGVLAGTTSILKVLGGGESAQPSTGWSAPEDSNDAMTGWMSLLIGFFLMSWLIWVVLRDASTGRNEIFLRAGRRPVRIYGGLGGGGFSGGGGGGGFSGGGGSFGGGGASGSW
jgi:uncharacterized protein